MKSSMVTPGYDLIIAGAGPAGSTLALKLADKGLRIAIIDRDVFPRPKVCGDALSGKVLNVMRRLPGDCYQDFLDQAEKVPAFGIRFVSPGLHAVDLPFTVDRIPEGSPPGYICQRIDFDHFLFRQLRKYGNISIFDGEKVSQADISANGVLVKTDKRELHGQVLAGADGSRSVIRKILDKRQIPKKYFCTGIRAYYEKISPASPNHFIELIFLRSLLPGYFWIFPSTYGKYNAGMGIMSDKLEKNPESLIRIFSDLTERHPYLADRFKDAIRITKPEVHVLPLGTRRLQRSDERVILLGDAAFLVSPFSGEGIGNAMASAEVASAVLSECFEKGDFSKRALAEYDTRIDRRFSNEFRIMGMIQRLASVPVLFDLVVRKASRDLATRNILSAMYNNDDARKKLANPLFYIKLMFR